MNKISIKISLLYFSIMSVILLVSLVVIHEKMVDGQVQTELDNLYQRGNSHSEVLESHFDEETQDHIVLMESKTTTDVMILDDEKRVISSSVQPNDEIEEILNRDISEMGLYGGIIAADWREQPYIASVSPFVRQNNDVGYVYMFKSTGRLQALIAALNQHFFISSLIMFVFLFISMFFLSRALTRPLLKMTEATKRLSKGDFTVDLPAASRDELGELSAAIQLLADDLHRLQTSRREFLASISHELRTPLTYIKGYSDIVSKNHINDEEREQYIDIIKEETEKLSKLIKDLLDLAKLDQHEFSIQLDEVPLMTMLERVAGKVRPAFQKKQLELVITGSGDIKAVVDPVRLEQVLLNLLDNARKYSHQGGKVKISVVKEDKVHLFIKDEGIGIPKEDLPYIFERLFRVDKSRNREMGGTGLGLSIVKELIEAQGGKINVQSDLQKGTTFELILEGEL
ncbi:sensor histidine kinase [Jeotgalibacillus soli]|uniref:sensor histidine kinase n=1 Tax=Jeotgalibacillus soli TaxID=889306 RepID=UPI00059789F0|nr:HAMP domain-containing sensor histidine kinase [Jeotgalibacillus soli]